jgi:hypothetical protein
MDYFTSSSSGENSNVVKILILVLLFAIGLIAVYALYTYLYGEASTPSSASIPGEINASKESVALKSLPGLYEGGDYTVNTWIYVNSFNVNRNKRKHVFEIGGTAFSTLLIALGAFKNTLVVRTHSRDAASSSYTASGRDASGNECQPATTETPNSQNLTDGSLTKTEIDAMFKPLVMDDTLLDTSPICDLPEIPMQKWVLVTVVLSGRVIDVYLDGKLARSCVTKSYFKVDPSGVRAKAVDKGGFDGYLSNITVYNHSLTPSDIYKLYLGGPKGMQLDPFSGIKKIFGV